MKHSAPRLLRFAYLSIYGFLPGWVLLRIGFVQKEHLSGETIRAALAA